MYRKVKATYWAMPLSLSVVTPNCMISPIATSCPLSELEVGFPAGLTTHPPRDCSVPSGPIITLYKQTRALPPTTIDVSTRFTKPTNRYPIRSTVSQIDP